MMLQIYIHRWFAMMAILNPKWRPKYKNPPIWKKFDFLVDYDVANWYQSLVCYGGHSVNDLRFQWKFMSILKWEIGW
jgi:hypothetical protein